MGAVVDEIRARIDRDRRSQEVGQAIQQTVAADPSLAVSIVGIGLDALSSTLINSPEHITSYGPWVELISAVYRYVTSGERSEQIDQLLGGSLAIGADTPGE